ncbi:MAG TPA: hypothetical protein VEF72_25840 [Mycobacterium sp.]|nr:hypothetical protein [Mycobacterium sp.]
MAVRGGFRLFGWCADLVVAVHLLNLRGGIEQRCRELAGLIDGDRFVGTQLVHHDVAGDAAVVVLRAADVDLDVGVMVWAIDDPP